MDSSPVHDDHETDFVQQVSVLQSCLSQAIERNEHVQNALTQVKARNELLAAALDSAESCKYDAIHVLSENKANEAELHRQVTLLREAVQEAKDYHGHEMGRTGDLLAVTSCSLSDLSGLGTSGAQFLTWTDVSILSDELDQVTKQAVLQTKVLHSQQREFYQQDSMKGLRKTLDPTAVHVDRAMQNPDVTLQAVFRRG